MAATYDTFFGYTKSELASVYQNTTDRFIWTLNINFEVLADKVSKSSGVKPGGTQFPLDGCLRFYTRDDAGTTYDPTRAMLGVNPGPVSTVDVIGPGQTVASEVGFALPLMAQVVGPPGAMVAKSTVGPGIKLTGGAYLRITPPPGAPTLETRFRSLQVQPDKTLQARHGNPVFIHQQPSLGIGAVASVAGDKLEKYQVCRFPLATYATRNRGEFVQAAIELEGSKMAIWFSSLGLVKDASTGLSLLEPEFWTDNNGNLAPDIVYGFWSAFRGPTASLTLHTWPPGNANVFQPPPGPTVQGPYGVPLNGVTEVDLAEGDFVIYAGGPGQLPHPLSDEILPEITLYEIFVDPAAGDGGGGGQ